MEEGIIYHNKDVLFKFLSELYKDATLDAFGIKGLPKITQLLPSNLPKVRADERRSDTQFLLEDGLILMLEYESNNHIAENHIRYLDYAQRILDREFREGNGIRFIHIAVVYTSDVVNVAGGLNAGDVGIQSEAILLSEHNSDVIFEQISDKIKREEDLTNEELMKLSVLPLMHSVKTREDAVRDSVSLAKRIKDERKQIQVIAGIMTATDKFVSDEFAAMMRRWLSMTKVGRIIAKEIEQERQAAIEENTKRIAKELINKMPPEEVAEITGMNIEDVKKLQADQ